MGEPVGTAVGSLLYIISPITIASSATPPIATPTIALVDNLTGLALQRLEQESLSSLLPSSHSSEPVWILSPHTVSHIKEILLNS